MSRYIIKRILMIIPVILGVSLLIYLVMEQASGDAILQMNPDASPEQIEILRHQYGYDRSVFYRYFIYLKGLLQGDLGMSITAHRPVMEIYFSRLPATVVLAVGSILVCNLISIPLGIISAVKNGSLLDNGCMVLALLGLSMPNFWLGLLLIIAFALNLHWFPSFTASVDLHSVVLPAITIGTAHTALLTRTTRSSMIDVLRKDYLRTARAKGVSERKVITKHALKNALIPIITISGTQFANALGGAMLTETVFAWPGVGRTIVAAINERDVPLATGCLILTTTLSSLVLLLVDILYAYVDPRIKAQYAGKKRGHKK